MAIDTRKYLAHRLDLAKEIAVGLEDSFAIARRYGFSASETAAILARPDFTAEVGRIRSDMEKSGQMFRVKAMVMADELLDNTFQAAMSPDIPVKDKAAALQLLTRIGDLEPVKTQQAQGAGFSITINIPSALPNEETEPVKIKPEIEEVVDIEPMELSFDSKEDTDAQDDE